MRLTKFAGTVLLITVVALIYVQLQVQIYEYAYKGKRRELAFKELLDRKSTVMYNINNLESVQNLGSSLLNEDYNLQFAGREQVVKLEAPVQLAQTKSLGVNKPGNKNIGFLVNFFALKSQAEAKPIK